MFYPVNIEVPLAAGGSEEGSVTINNQPFIWMYLGHQIIGNTADAETTGLWQDGQYMIEMKDEQSNYQSSMFAASAAIGGPGVGYQINLPLPIPYPGTKTLTFRITNNYLRVLNPEPDNLVFTVQLVVAGVADWGRLG